MDIGSFVNEQCCWTPVPGARPILLRVEELFRHQVLSSISEQELLVGKYELTVPGEDEPDDGIILKRPDKYDKSAAETGVPPDSKVVAMCRERTVGMLQADGLYHPNFVEFFEQVGELRRCVALALKPVLAALNQHRPDLGGVTLDHDRTVIRIQEYHVPRLAVIDPDEVVGVTGQIREPGEQREVSGKLHTDRCALTLHLYDSTPGLLIRRRGQPLQLIETRPDEGLVFLSQALARRGVGVALLHGADACPGRVVIVCFVHLHYGQGN